MSGDLSSLYHSQYESHENSNKDIVQKLIPQLISIRESEQADDSSRPSKQPRLSNDQVEMAERSDRSPSGPAESVLQDRDDQEPNHEFERKPANMENTYENEKSSCISKSNSMIRQSAGRLVDEPRDSQNYQII
jgi:hypothetical protein